MDGENAQYRTGFVNFYASMIKTPFLGDKYHYILPGSILMFSLLFIIINVCNYEAKVVSMMRKFNKDNSGSGTEGITQPESSNFSEHLLHDNRANL